MPISTRQQNALPVRYLEVATIVCKLSFLLVSAALAGCATVTPTPSAIAGTSWQLIAIQSMDDAQGTTRVDEPSRYTVTFGADGRAAFRLDCNRANAEWKAAPASTGSDSGQLTFGPLASTRAMCAPGSMDHELSVQLPFVRSYLLRNGDLHMSLLADGGILDWAPAE